MSTYCNALKKRQLYLQLSSYSYKTQLDIFLSFINEVCSIPLKNNFFHLSYPTDFLTMKFIDPVNMSKVKSMN